MPTYSLIFTGRDGAQKQSLSEFGHDALAVEDAKLVLTNDLPMVVIGRGSGDSIKWLGCWDYEDGVARWYPEAP